MEYSELEKFMIGVPDKDGSNGYSGGVVKDYPQVERWLIERAANGGALISKMRQALGGNFHIEDVVPKGSKLARAQLMAPLVESGHVLLPMNQEWVKDFVYECKRFPAFKRNDQVDCMTMAINDMSHLLGIGSYRSSPSAKKEKIQLVNSKPKTNELHGKVKARENQWLKTVRRGRTNRGQNI